MAGLRVSFDDMFVKGGNSSKRPQRKRICKRASMRKIQGKPLQNITENERDPHEAGEARQGEMNPIKAHVKMVLNRPAPWRGHLPGSPGPVTKKRYPARHCAELFSTTFLLSRRWEGRHSQSSISTIPSPRRAQKKNPAKGHANDHFAE